jgi:23S rRNA pseudouridine1911/1915/1917 synthase
VREEVPGALEGERADKVVAVLGEVSRAVARAMCEEGRVAVDGRRVAARERLPAGALISFTIPEPGPLLRPEPIDLTIRYEDEHLLVVDKPPGMVVHPGAGRRDGTLAGGLLHRYPEIRGVGEEGRWGIVHRLDRDTSGLLVVARSEDAHRRLQGLLRRRALEREYLALVRGRPRSRRGRIDAPIGRDRRDPKRMSLDTDSPRDAVTHFEIAELLPRHTLLRVRLETGRTHQIRVHLGAIDLPVAGDPVYGIPGDLGLRRQFLHAARLAFPHPLTKARVDVESPLPDDLRAALEAARSE